MSLQLEHLPSMVTGVWTDDNNLQLEATTQFRKLLSIGLGSVSLCLICCLVNFNGALVNLVFCVYQNVVRRLRRLYRLVWFLALLSFSWGKTFHSCRFVLVYFVYSISDLNIAHGDVGLLNVAVWGSLGFDKYSFWDVWKHQGCHWSRGCPNFREATCFS